MKLVFFWLDIDTGHKPSVNHGVAWMAGYLKSLGHQVHCHVLTKSNQTDAAVQVVSGHEPDCIGFSLTTNQRHYLDDYAEGIRKHFNGLIICGGVHSTLRPEDILQCEAVDGACIGEGEFPLSALAEHIDNDTDYLDTPSFWWKSRNDGDNGIIKNEVAPFVKDLANLPFPDYTLFDMNRVHQLLNGYSNVMISRGCPYSCTYCCNDALKSVYSPGQRYFRILSPEASVEFLAHHRQTHPEIKAFMFEDDLLLWNKKWLTAFLSEYKQRIGLPFMCNGRFDLMQDKEIAEMLKDAGCRMVLFGLESGDETYRKQYLERRITDNHILNAASILDAVNLNMFTYNILAFPLETKEMMGRTVGLNKRIRPSSGTATFFYPYPNTKLYDLSVEQGLLDPEKMKQVSGYKECPVIKMTHCTEKDCVSAQQDLSLYFMSRRLSTVLGIRNRMFEFVVHRLLLCFPAFFTRLFRRENAVKRILRKVQYSRF